MNKKVLSIVLSLSIPIVFLIWALSASAWFNFIPYAIHESISPGGASETIFIRVFDIAFSILIFGVAYSIFKRLFK